jgi:hypothetical protein
MFIVVHRRFLAATTVAKPASGVAGAAQIGVGPVAFLLQFSN